MVLQRGQAPTPARPWEDAPEVAYRLYKNRIKMARSFDSAVVTIKRLILREAASESEGLQFIIEEDSADTAHEKPPIHKIPQLPISKNKYFVVAMHPPEDLDDDDTPMDGDKPVKFLFSFYNLYLTGYSYDDDVWRMFDDAMIEGISQEARQKFVQLLGFPGNYGSIGQNYRELVIGFGGQCDTYNKVVGVSSGKTSNDQLITALCRTTVGLPESTRFPFLAQFHLRSFHSGNFDAVLDRLVIPGEEYRNFSLHLTKWGTYSTIGKKGKNKFDASIIPSSGINSFSALLNFIAVATNKKYDEELNLLKHEVAKKQSIGAGDADADKKGGNLGQDKNNEDSQDNKKTDQDNDETWFYEAPMMPYVPHGRQNVNLAGEPDVDTCAMLEIDRKTCLKELNWTLLLQLAIREACKYVKEKLSVKVDKLGKDSLINCAKTSMSWELIRTDNAFTANMYFVEAGAIAVRCLCKEDSRHVAKVTGATRVITVSDLEGEETFDTSFLGHAGEVVEERISDDEINLVKGTKNTSQVSVILRGANDFMLDEIEPSLHDALFIVKRTLDSNVIVAVGGGAAVEAALSVCSENQAMARGSGQELAIGEVAECLSVRPKVPGELTLEGPWESPVMGKARLVERTSHPLCGPSILTAGLDAKRARSWYGDTKNTSQVSVILRGANDFMLDEVELSLHDALFIVKRTLDSNTIVAVGGGAAVEAALSVCSENQAMARGSGQELAIGEVAECLSVRPKVPGELTLEGPWESPVMGKARLVERTSHPLCGPSILTAGLDAKRARSCYGDTKNTSQVSVILRGANDFMLDEVELSLHDALFIVKRTLDSNTIVAVGGGAAVEAALSVCSENQAMARGSGQELAIGEVAECLSVRPKVPGELTLEGPWESPVMGKARLVERTSHPLCGPSILTAGLDAKRARSCYGDTKNTSQVSVILRGANDFMLDEVEPSLHDALFIVKRTLDSNTIVAVGGGAAVEAALSVCSENQAMARGSGQELAIGEVAECLSVRPKVPGELTLEGPWESPVMGKARLVERTSHPLCGPSILTAGLDAKRARSCYGDTKNTSQVSVILRGANDFMLDEVEPSLHDALFIVKRTLDSNTIVAVGGGAAVEAALSVCSDNQAMADLGSGQQLAIGEVAESLSVRPKVPGELALEGPWESPGTGKARVVECTSHPLCGPSILTAHEDWEHQGHYPLGRLGIAA